MSGSFLGIWELEDTLVFSETTHNTTTQSAADTDTPPTYRIYEGLADTPLLEGVMAKQDDANTAGFYSAEIELSADNGFQQDKGYRILITAEEGEKTNNILWTFQIKARPPSAAEIAAVLAAAHGIGSWVDSGPAPSTAAIDAALTAAHGAGSWEGGGSGGTIGPGANQVTFTVLSNGDPVADADVWVSTDPEGLLVIAGTLQTNSMGKVTFMLDAGNTYYLWAQKDGINSILGEEIIAEAD